MEKKCLNCKYYWGGNCHNENTNYNLGLDDTYKILDDSIISYTEQGYASEYLRDNINIKELFNEVFKEKLSPLLKKTTLSKLDVALEECEINLIETLDEIVSNCMNNMKNSIDKFKNNECEIKIVDPNEFYCCNWE